MNKIDENQLICPNKLFEDLEEIFGSKLKTCGSFDQLAYKVIKIKTNKGILKIRMGDVIDLYDVRLKKRL